MCQNRTHRFRMTIKNLDIGTSSDLVVNAKGISDAVALADAWCHAQYKSKDVGKYGLGEDASAAIEITIHRVGYSDRASAEEHGADFRNEDESQRYRDEWAARAAEESLAAKYG